MEQKTLAKWLKVILLGIAVCGLLVYFFVVPSYGKSLMSLYPEFAYRYYPWLFFLWASGIPCYAVLLLGWKIATNIGRDRSFSQANADYLKWISWLSAGDSAFFFLGNLIFLYANLSHPGVALAQQRREAHEDVGDPVAHVLVVPALRIARPGRQRLPRVRHELPAGLVQAHERPRGVERALVDAQHVLHGGYELAAVLGDAPLLVYPWPKLVFFRRSPTATWLMDST